MAKEVRPVQVTIKCQAHGFGFDLDADLFVDEIDGLLRKLEAASVSPAMMRRRCAQRTASR